MNEWFEPLNLWTFEPWLIACLSGSLWVQPTDMHQKHKEYICTSINSNICCLNLSQTTCLSNVFIKNVLKSKSPLFSGTENADNLRGKRCTNKKGWYAAGSQ